MGGCPGSAYSVYEGMEAHNLAGLEALFDHAEVGPKNRHNSPTLFNNFISSIQDSMVLYETARSIHPAMCRELEAITINTEKLGTTGTTLYLCDNYTSAIHRDKDATRGLCAQFVLKADVTLREYAFIYASYGLYVVSQANSLW